MSKITSYNDLSKFDFKNKTQHMLIIRAYHKYDPHNTYRVYHDALIASGSDWVQLSKNFNQVATQESSEDFTPELTYNLMADKNFCYGKIVEKLAEHFNYETLGINAKNTPTQNAKAVEKIIAHPAFQKLRSGLKDMIINLRDAAKEHTGQKFIMEYKYYDTCLVDSDIKNFFKTQLFNTGKYTPDDVIVLCGDNEVKKFIASEGGALLKKIKVDPAKADQRRREIYLRGFYSEGMQELFTEDMREVNPKVKFPKGYDAYTKSPRGIQVEQ